MSKTETPTHNRFPWSCAVAWAARICLAGIFFYSGFVKAGASEEFLISLLPFTFLPQVLLEWTAFGLPWVEIGLAVGLLWPGTARVAALATILLMGVFIGVLAWALSEGIIVGCSCFGEDEDPSATMMVFVIVRDAGIAAAAFLLMLFPAGLTRAGVGARNRS